MLQRLFPVPKFLVFGAAGTGWLGSMTSWVLLGFSLALGSWSIGSLGATDEACSASAFVCRTAGAGGLLASTTGVVLAIVCSHIMARGFGAPVHWWAVPGVIGTAGVGLFLTGTAGSDAVPTAPVVGSIALIVVSLAAIVAVLSRGRTAIYGWVRTDGLDLREVRVRTQELALPVAAAVAGSASAAFGIHVARLLASG